MKNVWGFVFVCFCLSLSCKLLKALFSRDLGGLAEALQAPAAWHPQHLILIPKTNPSLFITADTVSLLCWTLATDYDDAPPLCCPGKTTCRSELRVPAGVPVLPAELD